MDAALDLSHTQNIGHMLRTHFNKSQFVVVSLKDGMFNNANVLFKTRFVDGLSTVRRHTLGNGDEGVKVCSSITIHFKINSWNFDDFIRGFLA